MPAPNIKSELESLSNPDDAVFLQRFFKTAKGEYGEGDRFRGIRVPALRGLSRRYEGISLTEVTRLLKSRFHEDRGLALMILTRKFERGDDRAKATIYNAYLKNTHYVNNWDLVDCSAGQIVGGFLHDRSRAPIHRLAKSPSLWERRIAVVATSYFIRRGDFRDILKVAATLLNDKEDLIHKAVGWMLREVGNKDRSAEVEFLRVNHAKMPRTMLRYAIEKFPENERQKYLKGQA